MTQRHRLARVAELVCLEPPAAESAKRQPGFGSGCAVVAAVAVVVRALAAKRSSS
jgi:hypothetical protein